MDFLSYFNLGLSEFLFIIFTVFIASIIKGFNGFGFSATCISGFFFILPAIEIVPIGVYSGDKFFVKSKEALYRKVVFYFLIIISISVF